MNEEYLSRAREQVKDVRLFINGVSRRAKELARGARKLVQLAPNSNLSYLDIALLEVAEGKVKIVPGETDSQEEGR